MGTLLIQVVQLATQLLSMLLVLYSLSTWVFQDPWHPARRFLEQLAEPIIRPFRNLIPPAGMFDMSVMVAIIVIQVAGQFIIMALSASFR